MDAASLEEASHKTLVATHPKVWTRSIRLGTALWKVPPMEARYT